jgi:hypothetical protein
MYRILAFAKFQKVTFVNTLAVGRWAYLDTEHAYFHRWAKLHVKMHHVVFPIMKNPKPKYQDRISVFSQYLQYLFEDEQEGT